ncbi:MAG: tRNA epoxyqueuosine(34) reductase QueG [Actinomycetota bacterium]
MSAAERYDGVALVEELREVAAASGLDRIGVCDASILERTRAELHRRKSAGLSDTMQFTFRNPERSTDPSATMTDVRSIVVGARSYFVANSSEHVANRSEPSQVVDAGHATFARVAKYAQHDHYSELRSGLEDVADVLRNRGFNARVIADENNLVDREVAYRAGIGWYGKNANLLLPGAGSWFVLGSVLTNAELPTNSSAVADGCGQCRRCIDACPTGAIVAEGVIDARKCLAWLLQKPGSFPREFRVDLGDRIYGCDDCQDSCPITVRLGPRHGARIGGEGVGIDGRSDGALVDLLDLLEASDGELMERFGRWYVPERDPIWVRRNALIILGNVAPIPLSPRAVAVLETCAQSSNPFLRAQTLWTAHRSGVDHIVSSLSADLDPIVQDERDCLDRSLRRVPQQIGAIGR